MTALQWHQPGERRYETGIDRGVLYLPEGGAVPWNGLVSVDEVVGREVKPYYIDGIRFLNHHVPGSYSAKLSAYTYPDEMDALVGTEEYSPGVFIHDQRSPKLFNLSYRTLVGNDVDGMDHAYKIHILYNLLAVLNDTSFSTIGEAVEPQAFSWSVYGAPSQAFGIRPTSHISLDSRRIDPAQLEDLENLLYGTETTDPILPGIVDFLALVETS
jgi:hypothetical protein